LGNRITEFHLPAAPTLTGRLAFKTKVRPVTIEVIKAEVKQLKINLQRHISQMENNVDELLTEKELHNIIG
jgi:hypothetical protein